MYEITLMPGNGIGPEIIEAVKKIPVALEIDIDWETYDANKLNDKKELDRFLDSCKSTQTLLKGPIIAPKGGSYIYTDWSLQGKLDSPQSYPTINALLRRVLQCHYGIRMAKKFEGVPSRYENVDIIIVRELSEDVYVASEYTIGNSVAVALKIISKEATENIPEGDICNACGQEFTQAQKERRLSELDKELEELEEKRLDERKKREELEDKLELLEEDLLARLHVLLKVKVSNLLFTM